MEFFKKIKFIDILNFALKFGVGFGLVYAITLAMVQGMVETLPNLCNLLK